jgi:phosphatidylglycerophosphatase C
MVEGVETASIPQITERIANAQREAPGGVVAFDGDGTLWSGDVGEDFFHALVKNADFRPSARAAMEADIAEFDLKISGSALDLARGLYAAYVDGRYPEERTCEMMTWACADWTRTEVDAFADKVVREGKLASRLHPEAIAVLEWARESKIDALLVSASPRPVVEAAGRVVGIDGAHVFAATPTYADSGVMLARAVRPIPYGPGKVTAIRGYAKERPLYAAFGDNVFDLAMLGEAKVGVAVRPKSRLRERAHEVSGIVEIQPILAR